MKILQIVPDISYESNGVTPVICGLARYFYERGEDISVCALSDPNWQLPVELLGARRSVLSRINEYSPNFAKYIRRGFITKDILHGHGLWSSANLMTGLYARHRTAKFVTSPHGTLTDYALSRRRFVKKLLWPVQELALTRADLLHATAESEMGDIRRTGYVGPIALIPNGIELPRREAKIREGEMRQLLYLGRIHPKKGIENLLYAWARVNNMHPNWELAIVGRGAHDYELSLRQLSNTLNLSRLKWVGPLYGLQKEEIYRSSDLFILPSHSENFGNVVAEAMSYELPCIVSEGAPWSVLGQIGAGWWIENSAEALASVMNRAMSQPENTLRSMGSRARHYVETNYSWEQVGRCFFEAYKWLVGTGDKPSFVFDR